jgi:hypothetical protein
MFSNKSGFSGTKIINPGNQNLKIDYFLEQAARLKLIRTDWAIKKANRDSIENPGLLR